MRLNPAATCLVLCALFSVSAAAQEPSGPPSTDAAPAAAPDDHEAPDAASASAQASPTEVVQAMIAAAKAGDEAAYKSHLSPGFIAGVERLQAAHADGSYAWSHFLASSRLDIAEMKPVVFYGKASVRATTAQGRVVRFALGLEGERWVLTLPDNLKARVDALDPPPAPEPDTVDAEPTPPPEASPAAAASAASEPEPPSAKRDDPLAPPATGPLAFMAPGRPGHYLWYAPDWLFVLGSAAFLATGGLERVPPPWIAIGPDYKLDAPDVPGLFDPRLDGIIGRPYVSQKVSVSAVAGGGAAALLGLAGLDAVRHQSVHHTHAFVLGALTAGFLTYDATEVLKSTVGRLRPDFRDRYVYAACGGYVEAPSDLDCQTLAGGGFSLTREDVIDGMRSFPSGHTSFAFSMASYATMYLGSEYIWGQHAIWWATPAAALAIGGAGAGAGFVAASRLSDNRHHFEDVAVGAALGSAIGAATYLVHFDLDGDARWRGLSLGALPVLGTGGGLTLSGQF